MVQIKTLSAILISSAAILIMSCASAPRQQAPVATPAKASDTGIPESYRGIAYPAFKYVAPFPADYRVHVSDSITGYVIEDRTLPLVHFTIFFRESSMPDSLKDRASMDLLSSMFRRGGAVGLSSHAIDDSLEFVSADISGALSTFQSHISIECLSKDLPGILAIAKKIYLSPAFETEPLEIQKAAFVNAYQHRYDTPASILGSLRAYANYASGPRLWDANDSEYKAVSQSDLQRLAKGKYNARRIIFALSGDFDKDSAITALKKYFADWSIDTSKAKTPEPLKFKNKPGIYLVNKDISQANISMSAPFVKRPHPDYYPTAVASFILGGGSFSSRLTARVRTDEGLAYSVYSTVDNDYRDTGFVTIALQTKVESAARALKLINEEVAKLGKEGPSADELALAKKTLIESLPSLFDTPENTAELFAEGELLGKKDSHYIDYVNAINAVTAEQVKAMIVKYFDMKKMTISIVGPADKLKSIGQFTVIPLDSLDFRK
ncbi:MAG: pitrilysin family protein [Fibrobacteraceae bacterium]